MGDAKFEDCYVVYMDILGYTKEVVCKAEEAGSPEPWVTKLDNIFEDRAHGAEVAGHAGG